LRIAETSNPVIVSTSGSGSLEMPLRRLSIIGSCGEKVPERDAKPHEPGRRPDHARVTVNQAADLRRVFAGEFDGERPVDGGTLRSTKTRRPTDDG
jgi:hypothetical protein